MAESDISPLGELVEILEQPEKRILPLLYGSKEEDIKTRKETRARLVNISQFLFKEIEDLAKTYKRLSNANKDVEEQDDTAQTLSGLPEMFVPPGDAIDAETLWGQVELQNIALQKMLKKSIKRLAKSPEDIVLIDMGQISSDEEEEDNSDDDEMKEISEQEEESDEENNEEEDEEAKRIRERMERATDDMDNSDEGEPDDDEEAEDEDKADAAQSDGKTEEQLIDPVADEMKDGFFDLNEMEDFADEEEEMLPDEAYGQPEKKKEVQKKKSFHQQQRDGDLLNRSDDEEDEDFDGMYEDNEPVRRKKYRPNEDIDALYALYQPSQNGKQAEDAANMSAADMFGQPRKIFIEQYKKNSVKRAKEEVKGDDDSWGEYDFEDEGKAGWGNEEVEKSQVAEDANDADEQEKSDEEEEEVDDSDKKQSKNKIDNSRHAKQAEKLRTQTEQLEKEMMAEKPWKMTGESKSTSRPVNSLLEGTPEFDMASKQAPTITVEHTANLEDVIKQRIIAEDWDDIVPRELPDVAWHKKRGELPEVSQEKSKLGLGELYEREYLKKAVGYDVDATEKQTEEDKVKDEMKQLFANLSSKLDALSNYHFAPRPIADEAEVRMVTAPAIAMEEVLPLHVSDARGVAPEEVFATKRGREGVLRGDTEMDQSERKRLRSAKKSVRRKARKEKHADEKLISRLEPGLGLNNPYEKRKMREELAMARSRGKITTGEEDLETKKFASSGTFFRKLQAEVQESIKEKAGGNPIEEKKSKPKSSAFKL